MLNEVARFKKIFRYIGGSTWRSKNCGGELVVTHNSEPMGGNAFFKIKLHPPLKHNFPQRYLTLLYRHLARVDQNLVHFRAYLDSNYCKLLDWAVVFNYISYPLIPRSSTWQKHVFAGRHLHVFCYPKREHTVSVVFVLKWWLKKTFW
jgi:hypothetical protein